MWVNCWQVHRPWLQEGWLRRTLSRLESFFTVQWQSHWIYRSNMANFWRTSTRVWLTTRTLQPSRLMWRSSQPHLICPASSYPRWSTRISSVRFLIIQFFFPHLSPFSGFNVRCLNVLFLFFSSSLFQALKSFCSVSPPRYDIIFWIRINFYMYNLTFDCFSYWYSWAAQLIFLLTRFRLGKIRSFRVFLSSLMCCVVNKLLRSLALC